MSEPFYCLDFKCKAFFTQLKYLQSLAVLVIDSQSIFFSWKKLIKNNHVYNRQDPHKQIALVFYTELHMINAHTRMQKYMQA